MENHNSHITEIGNAIVMSREFLTAYTNDVAVLASKAATEQYRLERSKDEKLTVPDIAKQEKCSNNTVKNWIKTGINKVKLKASRKGTRDYIVTRYDLNQFLVSK